MYIKVWINTKIKTHANSIEPRRMHKVVLLTVEKHLAIRTDRQRKLREQCHIYDEGRHSDFQVVVQRSEMRTTSSGVVSL